MIRKILKPKKSKTGKLNDKIDAFAEKYNIPNGYLHISRRLVTRGIFVGLFWGLVPMPMQMLAVILTMTLFKFNVPIAISMVWLSNPATMPFMYYIEYMTGNLLLGKDGVADVQLTIDWFKENWSNIILPLYVGTAFYMITIPTLASLLVNWLWVRSVKDERAEKRRKGRRRSQ